MCWLTCSQCSMRRGRQRGQPAAIQPFLLPCACHCMPSTGPVQEAASRRAIETRIWTCQHRITLLLNRMAGACKVLAADPQGRCADVTGLGAAIRRLGRESTVLASNDRLVDVDTGIEDEGPCHEGEANGCTGLTGEWGQEEQASTRSASAPHERPTRSARQPCGAGQPCRAAPPMSDVAHDPMQTLHAL